MFFLCFWLTGAQCVSCMKWHFTQMTLSHTLCFQNTSFMHVRTYVFCFFSFLASSEYVKALGAKLEAHLYVMLTECQHVSAYRFIQLCQWQWQAAMISVEWDSTCNNLYSSFCISVGVPVGGAGGVKHSRVGGGKWKDHFSMCLRSLNSVPFLCGSLAPYCKDFPLLYQLPMKQHTDGWLAQRPHSKKVSGSHMCGDLVRNRWEKNPPIPFSKSPAKPVHLAHCFPSWLPV